MKRTVELTQKQIDALLWAIELTEDSFAGWSNEEKGAETCRDLATLSRAEAALLGTSQPKTFKQQLEIFDLLMQSK